MKRVVRVLCISFVACLLLGSAQAESLSENGSKKSVSDLRPTNELILSGAMTLGSTLRIEKSFSQLAPTTRMPFVELVGDNGNYNPIKRYPAADKYKVVVDIYHQVVMAYSKDANGKYTVPERYMICTTGGPNTPTPTGVFKAGTHRPRFGEFVNDGVYGQYWTQVTGKIYFHSILYTQRNASTYTVSSYNLLGNRGSHGCIRLLVPDVRWIYYHIGPGATVEIRQGSKSDTATANIKRQLVRAAAPSKRPNANNVPSTDNWSISGLNAQLNASKSSDVLDGSSVRQSGDGDASSGL